MGLSSAKESSLLFLLQDQFFKYFVTGDPQLDSLTFSPASAVATLTALSQRIDATDPALGT